MALHADLTGAELHEPKGVDSASADTVYIADGAGSGAWVKIPSSTIDSTSVKNVNKEQLTFTFTDIGTAGSKYLVMGKACRIDKVWTTPQLATATAATVVTVRNDAGTSMGTISIPSGAAAGSIQSLTPASNNTFTAGTKLQLETDGGTSTASDVTFTIELTWV